MGFFDKLFGKRKDESEASEEPPKADAKLPFESLILPGTEAVATCLRLRQEGAGIFTPVMLGDPNELEGLLDGLESNAESTPKEIIEQSRAITISSFIKDRMEEDEELYRDVEDGEWPDNVKPSSELTGHTDIVRRTPLKRVAICKVPTPRSWEVPAYLGFGGWNSSPSPEQHVAILRYWHEKYGADIITLTNDTIECTVSNPPTTRQQAMELAREQFIYCSDIVTQGTLTISSLAASLQGGTTWFFWWD